MTNYLCNTFRRVKANWEASMKNKKLGLILLFSFAVALTGCNKEENITDVSAVEEDETGFGITLEEQQMCAEYAAGVLMKYNAGSNMRVLEGKKLEIQKAEEQKKKEQEEKRQQLANEYEASKEKETGKKKDGSGEHSGNSSGVKSGVTNYINDMSVATGTDSFSIRYDGYEVAKSYSENDDFFSVDAVKGKILVIAKFLVTNNGSDTESFNMYSNGGKYSLNLNGESYKAQQTLLLNDLSMYKGEVNSGETIHTVLVFEIAEEKVSDVNNMELDITVEDAVSTMILQADGGNDVPVAEETMDIAEEYQAALQAEENAATEETAPEAETESNGGNVTVVGSNNSISYE